MSPFDVFQSALELSTHEEQDAFVIETCLGNDVLRAEVLSLLEAHRHVGDFLESRNLTGSISQAMTQSGSSNDRSLRLAVSIARLKKLLAPSPDPEAWGMLKHFSVLGVVDAGGYGLVVRARDETLRRTVAIKLLDPTCQMASESQSQFLKEAQSAAQINHENVVRIHSVHPDPIPFIVMEYVHGTTLTSYLRDHSTFPVPVLINLSHQIASGLAAAHECGLVHRDVKPGNILVELKDKDFPRIKLADFGLALGIEESTSPSDSSDFIGTPSFAAPEQARSLEIGPRTDLFSLGSVLYFMATGLAPFRANSTAAVLGQILHLQPRPIREIRPEVPQWFCDLVERLHQKDPEKRPQSALEVVRWIVAQENDSNDPNANLINTDFSRETAAIEQSVLSVKQSRLRVWIGIAIGSILVSCIAAFTWLPTIRFLDPRSTRDSVSPINPSTVDEKKSVAQLRRTPNNHRTDLPDWNLSGQSPVPLNTPCTPEEATKCQQAWADHLKQPVITNTSINLSFALVPPGDFEKTFTRNRDGGIHPSMPKYRMRLTKPYRMATTEVTLEQFQSFVNETKYITVAESIGFGCLKTAYLEGALSWHSPGWPARPTEPVTLVTEQDAIAFCEWLSKKENRRFRLPTEAEWIHACRAGSESRFGYNNVDTQSEQSAWGLENSGLAPNLVGQLTANPLGIHDMLGNVWERTSDWLEHIAMLPYLDRVDPKGVPISNTIGGCYVEPLSSLQTDLIIGNWSTPSVTIGFRVVEDLSVAEATNWDDFALVPANGNPVGLGAFTTSPAQLPGLATWTMAVRGPQSRRCTSPVWIEESECWIVGGDEGSVSILNREGQFVEKLIGPPNTTEVKVSPDGKWVAVKDSDGTNSQHLYLFHWPSKKLKAILPTDGRFWNFAPDSSKIAFAKMNRGPWNNWGAYELDLSTGTTSNLLVPRWIDTLAWSPKVDRIVCQTRVEPDTMLEVLEYPTLQRLKSIPHHRITQLAISPDGSRFVVPDTQGSSIDVRMIETLDRVTTIDTKSEGSILSLQWYEDGDRLFVASTKSYCVVRVSSGEVVVSFEWKEPLSDSPRLCEENKTIVATELLSGDFLRFDSDTGQPLGKWGQTMPRTQGEFTPFISRNMAHFAKEDSVRTMDLSSFEITREVGWLKKPWGSNLRSSSILGLQNQNLVQLQLDTHISQSTPTPWIGQWFPYRLTASHDKSQIACQLKDENGRAKVIVADSATGNILCDLKVDTNEIGALEYSPDDESIAGLVNTGSVQLAIWDAKSGDLRSRSVVPAPPILSPKIDVPVRFHPNEPSILVGSVDSLHRFDLKKQIWTIVPAAKLPMRDRSVIFQPGAETWMISSGGRIHHLYDSATNEYLGEIVSSPANPSWAGDGSWIVLNQSPISIRILDGQSLSPLGTIVPYLDQNDWIVCSPDGHHSGSDQRVSKIIYVAVHQDGTHRTYSPDDFAQAFGWQNDPGAVRFFNPLSQGERMNRE